MWRYYLSPLNGTHYPRHIYAARQHSHGILIATSFQQQIARATQPFEGERNINHEVQLNSLPSRKRTLHEGKVWCNAFGANHDLEMYSSLI